MDAESEIGPSRSRRPLWKRALILAFYAAVLSFCVWAVREAFKGEDLGAVVRAFLAKPLSATLGAVGLVALVYASLVAIEAFAMRDAAVRPPFRRVVFSACVGNAIAIAAGFGPLSGGAVRARLFAAWGLNAGAGAMTAAAVTAISLSGGATVAAIGLLLHPQPFSDAFNVPQALPRLLGAAALLGLAGLVVGANFAKGAGAALGVRFHAPGPAGAVLRLGAGAVDWMLSALVLFALLPEEARGPFLEFAAVFAAAHFVAMGVGAPAGLGVFDALMLHLAPGSASAAEITAALIHYRLVAFALPFLLAAPALAIFEGRLVFRRRKKG